MSNEMIKLLIVDDEKLAVKYYMSLVNWEIFGINLVGTANDGTEALNIVREKQPDIILTDIKMPVMNGIELATLARELLPDIHILFVTSYTDFNYALNALKVGADDYIMKDAITADVLISKMLEIKKKIVTQKSVNSYTVESVMEDLFRSGKIGSGKLSWLDGEGEKITGKKYFYLIIREDTPIPTAAKFFSKQKDGSPDKEIIADLCRNLKDDYLKTACVFVSGSDVVVILESETTLIKHNDKSSVRALILDFALRLQARCAGALHKSFCVFMVREPKTPAEAGKLYIGSEDSMQAKIFLCRGLVIDLDSKSLVCGALDESFDASHADALIKSLDAVSLQKYLEGYFQKVREKKDIGAFDTAFYGCLGLLKKHGQGLCGIKSGRAFEPNLTAADEPMMYTVPCAAEFLISKFCLLITIKKEGMGGLYSKDTLEIIRFVMDNFPRTDLDADNISKSIAMSTARAEVKFKCETGLTLIDYLNKYRIKKASELLSLGENKIYEISEKVGFSSSQYFSKVFKKYTGATPIEYRKKISDEAREKFSN